MRKENKPRWGLDDINNLIYMYRHGTSIEEIAAELGRTECAVKMRLSKLRDAGHLPASRSQRQPYRRDAHSVAVRRLG